MIVSHRHRYIFVAIPHTGSTAIERELCEFYGGTKVRHKHSLPAFLPYWTSSYKVVGGVRNPATDIVTQYNKYATDHLGIYSKQLSGQADHIFMTARSKSLFKRVHSGELDLDGFVAEVGKRPVVPKVELNRGRYNYIYRLESLNEEFPRILSHLGLVQQRDPPHNNRTNYSNQAVDLDQILQQPAFRVAALRFGYLKGTPSAKDLAVYHLASAIKRTVWLAREARDIVANKGFFQMQAALTNVVPGVTEDV